MEHYVTLFDSFFLPQGLALHRSMQRYAGSHTLWILCVDEEVFEVLVRLQLPNVQLMQLGKLETPELLSVKPYRSRGEYCWTLTPFAPRFVMDSMPSVNRVTYLDADLFFFDSPQLLLRELEGSGKSVLITEHAYAPEYDQTRLAGRFCVQFMTFKNNDAGVKVMRWWQEKCIEWCFNRYEEKRFGDQKYLDVWPELFESEVHILEQTRKTLAPWNVRMFEVAGGGSVSPVFYHFQELRIIAPDRVMLYTGYRIGGCGMALYDVYMKELSKVIERIRGVKAVVKCIPLREEKWQHLRILKRRLLGTMAFRSLG